MCKPLFATLGLLCLLYSCTAPAGTEPFLQQPPFDKLTDSITREPRNADLYYKRGLLLYQHNRLDFAKADVEKAWNLNSTEEYAAAIANILSKTNEDTAIHFLRAAIQKLPQSILLKIKLAKALQTQKKNDEALAVCNEIIAAHPTQLDALTLQSQILKALHRQDEALATLEKAYSYAPSDADLCYTLAFEYAQNKNPKAIRLSDSLLKKDASKTHAEPYYFKGLYYENTGNTTLALQYLNEAIQHDYYFLDTYMEKGQVLYNQKQYAGALQTFRLAAAVSPTFADAYLWMGKCNEVLNNKTEAKLNYQRAYGLDKTLAAPNP